ncbi:hypothetical protein IWQ61_005023 [Dispira simplex]|nr:hypothetical protein IWQ61_005023 [Dispira simplex]
MKNMRLWPWLLSVFFLVTILTSIYAIPRYSEILPNNEIDVKDAPKDQEWGELSAAKKGVKNTSKNFPGPDPENSNTSEDEDKPGQMDDINAVNTTGLTQSEKDWASEIAVEYSLDAYEAVYAMTQTKSRNVLWPGFRSLVNILLTGSKIGQAVLAHLCKKAEEWSQNNRPYISLSQLKVTQKSVNAPVEPIQDTTENTIAFFVRESIETVIENDEIDKYALQAQKNFKQAVGLAMVVAANAVVMQFYEPGRTRKSLEELVPSLYQTLERRALPALLVTSLAWAVKKGATFAAKKFGKTLFRKVTQQTTNAGTKKAAGTTTKVAAGGGAAAATAGVGAGAVGSSAAVTTGGAMGILTHPVFLTAFPITVVPLVSIAANKFFNDVMRQSAENHGADLGTQLFLLNKLYCKSTKESKGRVFEFYAERKKKSEE